MERTIDAILFSVCDDCKIGITIFDAIKFRIKVRLTLYEVNVSISLYARQIEPTFVVGSENLTL